MPLPNLNLTATVVANGKTYPGWEAIEIWREFNGLWAYLRLRAIENTDAGGAAPAFDLEVGDRVVGSLCGQKVISGWVMTRQVAYDKATHGVEIIVCSYPQSLEAGTVTGKPGQYKQQTFQQIANAVAGQAGVKVKILGSPPGSDLPFARVSEHIGERMMDFIGRLARWRNLFLCDDEDGNLVATRGQANGGGSAAVATLQEGRNIESCRMVMNYQFGVDPLIFQSQQPGSDANNGTAAAQNAYTYRDPNYVGPKRPQVILGDHSGSPAEAKMAMQHTIADTNIMMWEVVATVPGWQMDDGSLWILKMLGQNGPVPITIKSPMLLPRENGVINNLFVKGVKHAQDNELGTRTEITCCLQAALGADQTQFGVGGSPMNPGGDITPGNSPLGQGGIGHPQ